MNVKVSKSALEKALRMLLEADQAGGVNEPPADPPEKTDTPEKTQGSDDKTDKERFAERVKALQKIKNGATFSVGDRKFQKRSGAFYLAGGDRGLTQDQLLARVSPDKREVVQRRLDKERKEKGIRAGVTIAGDEFIDSTDRSATFRYGGDEGGNTMWIDEDGIPIDVIAQYYFDVVEDTRIGNELAGEVVADLLGPRGAEVLVYRSAELMIVVDPSTGNLHIMSAEFNDYDPLLATKTLLTQIKLADKVGDDPNDEKQGSNEYASVRAGYNAYLKPNGTGESYMVPLQNFQLGELRKSIASVRTIFGKFFDLFNRDDIQMNFKFTQWGPSMTRSKVFGGDAFEGGTGALTAKARQRLLATGLFREESLPAAGDGIYNVRTDDRQDLAYLMDGKTAQQVSILPMLGDSGARVEGLKGNFGVQYTDDTSDTYENTYGDAYFLYMKKVMSVQAPAEPEEEPQEAEKKGSEDPLAEICNKDLGQAVGINMKDKAALFQFAKTEYLTGIQGFDANQYISDVAGDIIGLYGDNKAYYDSGNRKIALTVVGTADQRGQDNFNVKLSQQRCEKFIADLKTALTPFTADKCEFNIVAVGETYWKGQPDSEPESTRAYKRFVKLYWCQLDQTKAEKTISDYVKPVQEKATGETGASATKKSDTAKTPTATNLTPEKSAQLATAVSDVQRLANIPGITLIDDAYVYSPEADGSVVIMRLTDGKKVTWTSKTVDPDRFIRFVKNINDKSSNYALSYGDLPQKDNDLYSDAEMRNPIGGKGGIKYDKDNLSKTDAKGNEVLIDSEGREVMLGGYSVLAPSWWRDQLKKKRGAK